MDVTELDPERFYVVSINPETDPSHDTAAQLLNQLHEHGIQALVMIGDASVRPADPDLLTAARLLLSDAPLDEEERIVIAELLTAAAVTPTETVPEDPT